MDKKHSAWDKNVPIEKSSYIVDSEIHLLNKNGCSLAAGFTVKRPFLCCLAGFFNLSGLIGIHFC